MATQDTQKQRNRVDRVLPNGNHAYEGPLGKFEYNPNEYQLAKIPLRMVDGKVFDIEILHYVGKETDGSKIHVPEGLSNGFMTFAKTGITSAPKMPKSMKYMDAMFMGAENLKDANIFLSKNVESASMAFTGCKNLKIGPDFIPGSIQNANYMFAQCEKLENTPKLYGGLKYADGMFLGCERLTEIPTIPKSVKSRADMTMNCSGLDATADRNRSEKNEAMRESYGKKIQPKKVRSRLASAFSCIMQMMAFRQMGYGYIEGPMMIMSMRSSGRLGRNMSDGFSAIAMAHGKGGLATALSARSAMMEAKARKKQQDVYQRKMDMWDKTIGANGGSAKDMKAVNAAKWDIRTNLFQRVAKMDGSLKAAHEARYGATYPSREHIVMSVMGEKGGLDEKDRKNMSQWYKNELSSVANYYAAAKSMIDNGNFRSDADKQAAIHGLNEVVRMQTEPLMSSMERMQKGAHLFNEGDIRDINRMSQNLPGENQKFANFGERVHTTAEEASMRHADIMNDVNKRFGLDEDDIHYESEMDFA